MNLPDRVQSLDAGAGVAATLDVYALLPQDGSSGVGQDTGGVTASNAGGAAKGTTGVNVSNPSTSSIKYDVTYTPAANFAGSDTISYKIINPAAPNPTANQINVTVYGITNASMSATAFKGVSSANWFTATTNGGGNFSSSNLNALTGLSISAGGVISGTPTATGNFNNIDVTVTTPAGPVSRTLTLDIAGITSASALNLSQNAGTNLPYTITAYPSAQAPYSIIAGALPAGLSLVGNQITGVPTASMLDSGARTMLCTMSMSWIIRSSTTFTSVPRSRNGASRWHSMKRGARSTGSAAITTGLKRSR